jgi:hypothetical protein
VTGLVAKTLGSSTLATGYRLIERLHDLHVALIQPTCRRRLQTPGLASKVPAPSRTIDPIERLARAVACYDGPAIVMVSGGSAQSINGPAAWPWSTAGL